MQWHSQKRLPWAFPGGLVVGMPGFPVVHPRLAFKAHCGPILIHPPQPLFTQFLTHLPPPLHLFESYLSKSGLSTTYSENTSQIRGERGETVSLRRKGI